MKVLVSGDVKGRFAPFVKRTESVNAKSGPFDMIFAVGSFFSANSLDFGGFAGQADLDLWNAVVGGKKTLPVSLYILGPNCQAELARYKNLAGYEMAENVVYLGTHGCFTTNEGLKIAYLSGVESAAGAERKEYNFSYEQIKSLGVQLKWNDSAYEGVDVLITSEWPWEKNNDGSKLISQLALKAKPRYHFAGLHASHIERQPYRNHKVLNEPAKHVTRFIALSNVANPDKKKWIYAFNVSPMATTDKTELLQSPADVTDNPYESIKMHDEEKRGQFFYDMKAGPPDDRNRKRKQQQHHQQQQQPKRKSQGPCWFCLSGAEVEKHLVVSIGEHAYLALPKGGLTPDHVLILPIAHFPSLLELPEEVGREVDRFKSALKKCFKKQGKSLVFFERNYKSQHLQLQVVPVPKDKAAELRNTFHEVSGTQNIDLADIPEHSSLAQMSEPGTPYFYVELPNKERLFHRVRSGFPIHFGREVLANPEVLNLEDRIDWRDCKAESKEEEAAMTKSFRSMFQPFDFTLEDEDE